MVVKPFVVLIVAAVMLSSLPFALSAGSASQPAPGTNALATAQGSGFYPVYVVEHNLPGGMQWYAYISQPSVHTSIPGTTKTATTPAMEFQEPPGTYSLSAGAFGHYVPRSSNIQATVVDKAVTVNVYFIQQFNVSVTEKGLPQGYNWELSLTDLNNSNDHSGTSGTPFRTSQWIYESPGTYSVQAGSNLAPGVSILGDVGDITVSNAPVNMTISFYKVNVTEKGVNLENASWGFQYRYYTTYNNGTQTSGNGFYPGNASYFEMYLPNSTYSILPVAAGYYSAQMRFNVAGQPLNITEAFQKAYRVTFIEHNLTTNIGGDWEVNGFPTGYGLNTPYIYGSSAQSYLVPNGTFTYNVTGISQQYILNNYLYEVKVVLENPNSTFTVSGENTTVNLYFNVTTMLVKNLQPGKGPVSMEEVALIILIIGSVAGVSYAYFTRLRKRQ